MRKIKKRTKRIKKHKTIHLLSILTLITFMILISKSVDAGTQDSTLVRNQISGVYAIAPLSDKTHLYNLEIYKVNNVISYCIEIGKSIGTNTYNSTLNINEQSNITKLSQSKLNYIKTIMYFGYGYTNHNDYKYYMAAQELIWEYLNNIDITWTNVLDINGTKINIDSYKNEILNLMSIYNSSLSFPTNIEGKVGDQITLTDTNNSLLYYDIINMGNQTAKIDKNNLIINVSNNYIGTDTIQLKRKNNYSTSSTLYYADNTQTLLSVGNLEDNIKTITLNIKGETLTTNLLDKDRMTNRPKGQATLAGAIYEIYDKNNKLISTFTTDETGINIIENLSHETYYIKQVKESKGYKLNNEIVEINLTSENNNVNLYEEVIKSTIQINKLYEVNNNYIKEENILFNVYDNNNRFYSSILTDKYTIDKIELPYGNYTLRQMTTTYGYNKIEDIIISIDENTPKTIRYDLKNDKLKIKINITTKDQNNVENINESDIKYKLKDLQSNQYLSYQDDSGITNDIFFTNSNGQVIIPIELPYGEYQLEQVSPPKKYLENNNIINIIINDETKYSIIDDQLVAEVDFFNKPIVGKLNITTNEEQFITEENNYSSKIYTRGNIEFELYLEEQLINTYKTNQDGYIKIDNLTLGNYCIKEKNSTNQECFELINTNNKIEIIEKEITITKKLNKTDVILSNIDNEQNPIKGTIVELYHENRKINTSITNDEGIIKIKDLPAGRYCFQEKEIPIKYIITKEVLCFNIEDTSKPITLTIKNNLNKNKIIKIPNTLSNNQNYLILILILLIIVGVVIHKKRNNDHNN